jgi:hypothetical protein
MAIARSCRFLPPHIRDETQISACRETAGGGLVKGWRKTQESSGLTDDLAMRSGQRALPGKRLRSRHRSTSVSRRLFSVLLRTIQPEELSKLSHGTREFLRDLNELSK